MFELLTGALSDRAAGRSGQLGIAEVRDPRLERLAGMYRPAKVTPAVAELMDTPGLDPRGGEENRQVVALMRQSDALLVVLGHYLGNDPADELLRLYDELFLADLTLITSRMEKLQAGLNKPRPEREREVGRRELDLLGQLARGLEKGEIGPEKLPPDQQTLRDYQLFVLKPRFVVLNLAESALGKAIQSTGQSQGSWNSAVCAKLELELSQLDEQDGREFMVELGLDDLCRDQLLGQLMRGTMGQISFFTVSPKEVRAWPVKSGATALEAAGQVHSDMARGFIRAEVIASEDLFRCGTQRDAKRLGLYRLEGKDYIVKDGDVIWIRFNV